MAKIFQISKIKRARKSSDSELEEELRAQQEALDSMSEKELEAFYYYDALKELDRFNHEIDDDE